MPFKTSVIALASLNHYAFLYIKRNILMEEKIKQKTSAS